VNFIYWGGNERGLVRNVTPVAIFRLRDDGPHYLAGHCHLRNAERIFNVEKMELQPK
jgi:predicted DNA-binding transcriptional regulator YafY